MFDKLLDLYVQYGFYKENLVSITKKGMNGAAEIRPSKGDVPAQLYARLAYLNIPPSSVPDVERMLSEMEAEIRRLGFPRALQLQQVARRVSMFRGRFHVYMPDPAWLLCSSSTVRRAWQGCSCRMPVIRTACASCRHQF